MIGDWVYNNVADITFQVYPQFFSQWHNQPEQLKAIIQPIPLTPEILENNGFEKEIVGGDTYFTLDDIVLQNDYEFGFDFGRFYRDSEDGFVLVGIITIKYVHQLQHALRLCGIDKEITI